MGRIKDRQKQNIVEKATDIFMKKGMFDTVMNEIAEAAGITRRTIYRYFETREDLAYEVMITLMEEWNAFQKDVFRKLEGSGIEKMEAFFTQLIRHMEKRMDFMAFAGEFDFFFKGNPPAELNQEIKERYEQIIHHSEELIQTMLEEGLKDGSIMAPENLELTLLTISNVLWSFGQRIAIMREGLSAEFGVDPVDMILCQLQIYIDLLKAPANK